MLDIPVRKINVADLLAISLFPEMTCLFSLQQFPVRIGQEIASKRTVQWADLAYCDAATGERL